MRSKRTSPEEQLRLITECRQSGLTDYAWCQQHDIKVSTFYAWIHRLKQSGEIDIPAVIPTVVRKGVEQPDIVKIKIEGERQIATAPKPVHTPEAPEEIIVTITCLESSAPVVRRMFAGILTMPFRKARSWTMPIPLSRA